MNIPQPFEFHQNISEVVLVVRVGRDRRSHERFAELSTICDGAGITRHRSSSLIPTGSR